MESISLETSDKADVENSKFGERLTYDASGSYQKTRNKTDFCWLVGLIVYLIIWSAVTMYAYSAGDTSKWLRPKDSAGRICGYDSDVQNKPYRMSYDSDSCTSSQCWVCLSHCPDNDFEFDYKVESTTASVVTGSIADSTTTEKVTTISSDLQEEKQTQKTNSSQHTSLKDVEKLQGDKQNSENNEKPEGLDKTQEGTTERNAEKNSTAAGSRAENNEDQITQSSSSSVATTTQRSDKSTITDASSSSPSSITKFERMKQSIICQSDIRVQSIDQWEDLKYLIDRGKCSKSYKKGDCLNMTSSVVADILKQSIKLTIASELAKTKFSIMGFLVLSGAITLAIIFLMRWCAMVYVCTSIFAICALLFYWIYHEFVYKAENKTTGVLLALLLGVLALVVIIAIAIYYARQISLACQMIGESSRAFTCVLSSIAVPIIFFLIYMLIFIVGVSVFFLLMSIETPVHRADFAPIEKCKCPIELAYWQNSTCDPSTFESRCRKPNGDHCILSGCYMVDKDSAEGFGHFINFIGLSWSFYFFAGFNDMLLGSLFSTWYWTFNKKLLSYVNLVESFWRISTYHLGTIALGSLLIIATSLIRTIVNSIKSSLNKSKGPCAAAALHGLQYLFIFMESFVDFIDRKAYIMCAIHGTDFIQSARAAYYLVKRNVTRVFAVIAVTRYFTFITTILVACLTTVMSMNYYVIDKEGQLKMDLIPIVIVFLGSCAITLMLMRVVEVAVETVFLCFLEDIERNDGTNEKPYFMSEQLTKFLYKK